mmetsp:Transcript_43150/g.140584  ORF Transcript_43150/g.140584 Transcript_43150/m.140584 type:complete len:247 (+) Transcript_43150:1017-1757(+)
MRGGRRCSRSWRCSQSAPAGSATAPRTTPVPRRAARRPWARGTSRRRATRCCTCSSCSSAPRSAFLPRKGRGPPRCRRRRCRRQASTWPACSRPWTTRARRPSRAPSSGTARASRRRGLCRRRSTRSRGRRRPAPRRAGWRSSRRCSRRPSWWGRSPARRAAPPSGRRRRGEGVRGPIARAPILRSASLVPTTTVCGPVFENAREGRARRVGHAACRRESLSLAVALWAVAMRRNRVSRVGDIFLR